MLTSLCNVAEDLIRLEYYEEALAKNEECYRLMCEVLGKRHPKTLNTLHNIVTVLMSTGRHKESIDMPILYTHLSSSTNR